MASLKAEKPAVGTQLFGQAPKKETASTKADGPSKSAASKPKKGGAQKTTQPQATKKKGKGGKAAVAKN